jgi:TIR domain
VYLPRYFYIPVLAIKYIAEQLKARGILPWLDEWELRPGTPWQRLLEAQISSIKTAAVFVGKDGIGPWQHNELDAFLREFNERGIPVIPVLLLDTPKQPQLPVFLRGMTWVDFRKSDPDPLQRLIWGITGERTPD